MRAKVDSGIWAPSTDMPNRNAVSCTGHCPGVASSRTSTIGSSCRASNLPNGTRTASPATTSTHGSTDAAPCTRIATSPPITSPMAADTSTRPVQSKPPAAEVPGRSSIPNQITGMHSVTAIAGSISSTVIDVDSTSAPEVSAPMITASSSAPTRMAAARRVSSPCRPVPAVRR